MENESENQAETPADIHLGSVEVCSYHASHREEQDLPARGRSEPPSGLRLPNMARDTVQASGPEQMEQGAIQDDSYR